jgi:hypothetical protein
MAHHKFSKTEKAYQASKPNTYRDLENMLKGLSAEYATLLEENKQLKEDNTRYERIFNDAKESK